MADIVERLKDAENATHALFNYIFQDAREEIERLRAKIARMEKTWLSPEGYHILMQEREDILFQAEKMKQHTPCKDISMWPTHHTQPTQPAPSINEDVRKVTLGFRWESEAQHHIPTIEIEFDPVSPDSPNDVKGWQDRDRIASMLSPEAKP